MFFFDYPVEPTGYVVHSKYCLKREHQCGDYVFLCQNWNQAVHTECIFCAFSRGTSISVALTSHKIESDI